MACGHCNTDLAVKKAANGEYMIDSKHWLDDGLTVRAKETQPQKTTKPPFSRLDQKGLSRPAVLVRSILDTQCKNDHAELIEFVAGMIAEHARAEQWPLKGREVRVARALVSPLITGDDWTDAQLVEAMGISRSTYCEVWRDRFAQPRRWVKQWIGEGIKAK